MHKMVIKHSSGLVRIGSIHLDYQPLYVDYQLVPVNLPYQGDFVLYNTNELVSLYAELIHFDAKTEKFDCIDCSKLWRNLTRAHRK